MRRQFGRTLRRDRGAGAGQNGEEALAIGRDRIAPPGDMLIGTNERKARAIAGAQALVGGSQDLQRNLALRRGGKEPVCSASAAASPSVDQQA